MYSCDFLPHHSSARGRCWNLAFLPTSAWSPGTRWRRPGTAAPSSPSGMRRRSCRACWRKFRRCRRVAPRIRCGPSRRTRPPSRPDSSTDVFGPAPGPGTWLRWHRATGSSGQRATRTRARSTRWGMRTGSRRRGPGRCRCWGKADSRTCPGASRTTDLRGREEFEIISLIKTQHNLEK